MSNKGSQNNANILTQLSLPAHFNEDERNHFEQLHQNLPPMGENELNIIGIELVVTDAQTIEVMTFIRSTLETPLLLESTPITLLDKNLQPFAEKEANFDKLGTLSPKTTKIFKFEFSKNDIIQTKPDYGMLKNWSIAFKQNIKSQHYVDFSDLNEDEISDATKDWLNEIDQKAPLEENELSFMGFSAKQDEENRLFVNLLIRNGTKDNLDIKQLPLKFYDATGDLAAKGTFKIDNVTVLANTSKPIALVFPTSSILKKDLDLSKWKIVHSQ